MPFADYQPQQSKKGKSAQSSKKKGSVSKSVERVQAVQEEVEEVPQQRGRPRKTS